MVRRLLSFTLLICFLSTPVFAQETRDILTEQFGDDINFPALPYYSYGSGLGWTTPDSTFRLNIRFRMQNRATYVHNRDEDDALEAAIRRLRLRFDGFVGDPSFVYAIQLSFAPGDVGELSEGDNINIIRDAVMFYQPNDNWSFGFGQTKLPGNRQRINSSGALQLTDRSINNAQFSIDRDFGAFAYYLNEQLDQFSYNFKTAISTGNGRNWTRNPSVSPAYTGRVELFPFGAFNNNGMLFEGDLFREQTPKLLLAGTYHYNAGAQRQRGTLGGQLFERRDLTSVLLDAMLKYRGWSFQAAYMTRSTDNPITVNPDTQIGPTTKGFFASEVYNIQTDPNRRAVFAGQGYDVQLSHIFANDIELIGRFSHQSPDSEVRGFYPQTDQYSFGVTKYIREHSLKLQSEITYSNGVYADGSDQVGTYFRFQIEIGI